MKLYLDITLFWNIPNFGNSISAKLDIFFSFLDVLLMFMEKSEVVLPFSWIKQAKSPEMACLHSWTPPCKGGGGSHFFITLEFNHIYCMWEESKVPFITFRSLYQSFELAVQDSDPSFYCTKS